MEEEYINFGDELILKSDFLKAIADAKAYSSTQPWSAARRGAFDAVSELAANRGILSIRKYTNPETGESMYYATFGGDPFDINTYDKNTRRGWLDYVNFVGRLAESLPTKKSIDEKKKKEEEERIAKLPTFDNNTFTTLLTKNISNGPLGGKAWDVNLWNTLDDVRDEKGAVGINNRKTELIKLLKDIDKNFKAEDYNWKDSPFLGADDFKARLAKAIGALESEDLNDDTPALRELGLNYKDWFNNRTGEIYDLDENNNPITYGAYYRALLELKDALTKAEEEARLNVIRLKILHYRERDKYFTQLQLNLLNNSNKLSENKEQTNIPRLLSLGMQYLDYARIGAALGDVISLGGFWANVGGSIVSLLGDTTADIADDKVSTWEAITNFGKNLGWTAAGFIPGGKLGKVAEHMLRWGPKLLVALNDYNLLNDESNKKTWNKLTSDKLVKEGLNDEDLKNITYWVRALTGTANAAKATARDVKYSKARGERKQEFTTKDNSKVTLSKDQVKEINKVGATKGQQAAKDLFKSKTGKDISDNEFSFTESGRHGLFKEFRSKLGDKRLLGKTVVKRNPTQQRYYDLYSLDRNKGGWFGWRPIWSRGTSSYFDHFDNGGFKNPLNGVTKKLDPYREIVSPKTETGTSENTKKTSNNITKENIKAIREDLNFKEYKDLMNYKKKDSSRGTLKDGSEHTIEFGGKSYNFKYDGKNHSVIINDKSIKIDPEKGMEGIRKKVVEFIRQLRKSNIKIEKLNKEERKELINKLKELKKKGFLKHGGTLDETIENFLKNNNI